MDERPGQDPGWGVGLGRILLHVVVPSAATRAIRRDGGPNLLLGLRGSFLSFVFALLLFPVPLSFIHPFTAGGPPAIAVALLAVGPASLVGVLWVRHRLRGLCDEPAELAQSFARTVFIGIAFAESGALFGFVATFLAEAWWVYVVGLAFSLGGLGSIAPTAGRIAALDQQISLNGCPHSLRAALYGAP